MKKRVLALICAAVVGVSSLTVSASASVIGTIGTVVGGIMAVKDVIDLADEFYSTSVEIYDGLADFWNGQRLNYEIERVNRLAIWECFITQGQISESNLREWYSTVLEVSGNVAYFTPPVSDEQMAIVNAYSLVQENVQYGITLDDICAHCYVSGVPTDNPDTGFDEAGNVQVSGKTFSEICAQLQEQYAPKADTKYISWKNEKNPNLTNTLSLYANGTFCNQSDWYEVYLVPFFYDGTTYYYGDLQYHFYNSDDLLAGEIYNNIDILSSGFDGYTPTSGVIGNNLYLSKYPYLSVGPFLQHYSSTTSTHKGNVPGIFYYPDYTSYLSGTTQYSGSIYNASYWNVCFYRSDITTTVCAQEQGFKANFVVTDGVKDMSTPCDIGFLVSDSFIELTGSIPDNWEMDKIPANYYVTFDGDNIYNYTITDPDTGGTSTVNEYVTNNYTIINNNYGDSDGDDSGSSGGTTSGDINVGGNIGVNGNVGVNGQVDVNLNVNVNTGSDGSGGTAEVDPYEYEKVNMGEALEQIPEMSDGFTGFLSDVFDFLPPPVLGLIIGGIGLAILCRLAGR